MNNLEYAAKLRNGLFADRETVREAYDYAVQILTAGGGVSPMVAYTALHVVMNTVANDIELLDNVTSSHDVGDEGEQA